ncbi:MAG: hypothetical protein JWO09_1549 [Bacteroidetes bacterium]|nr:hypothetical protein [Bacteroidota bacterium]
MIICTFMLFPLYIVLQVLIPLIQQVITTVCSWVSSILTTFQTVWSQVCSWLPWPLNLVCNWVSQVITVIQTVWNYICNTIITTIITILTFIITLLIYLVGIICYIINFVVGIPAFLLCKLSLSPKKKMRICIKVLTDEAGNSKVDPTAIKKSIERTISAYQQCKVEVIIVGITYMVKPAYLTSTNCSFGGLFSAWHVWFSTNACWCCNQITVFFVDSISGASGCTYWGDSWCRVDSTANSDDTIMAHEIGHILGLSHSSNPNNIMYASFSATAHNFTSSQCCFLRQSPYITFT